MQAPKAPRCPVAELPRSTARASVAERLECAVATLRRPGDDAAPQPTLVFDTAAIEAHARSSQRRARRHRRGVWSVAAAIQAAAGQRR